MLQEGNASRERLNEFNDLIYCFILYTVYTLFTFDENLHTDIFSLSGDGEQTIYSTRPGSLFVKVIDNNFW